MVGMRSAKRQNAAEKNTAKRTADAAKRKADIAAGKAVPKEKALSREEQSEVTRENQLVFGNSKNLDIQKAAAIPAATPEPPPPLAPVAPPVFSGGTEVTANVLLGSKKRRGGRIRKGGLSSVRSAPRGRGKAGAFGTLSSEVLLGG